MTKTNTTNTMTMGEAFDEFLKTKHMNRKRFESLKPETQDRYVDEFKAYIEEYRAWKAERDSKAEEATEEAEQTATEEETTEQSEEQTTEPEEEQSNEAEETENPEEEQSDNNEEQNNEEPEEKHTFREKSLKPTTEQTAILQCIPDTYEIMIWKCNKNMVTCYKGRRQLVEIMTGRVKRVSTNLKYKVAGMTDRHSGYGMDATVVCEEADIPKYVSAIIEKYDAEEAKKKQEADAKKQTAEQTDVPEEAKQSEEA